jgi:hypothetical protein
VYFLHAIKRVHGMRLIKPQWNEGLVAKLLPVTPKMNNKLRSVEYNATGLDNPQTSKDEAE